MDKLYVLALIVFAIFTAFSVSYATSSIHISINPINTSIGIDQNLYVEVTYSSPSNSTYEVLLNSTEISSGSLSANQNLSKIILYNVTDLPYGSYRLCASFSILTQQLCSSSNVYISPHPGIEFKTNRLQPIFNGSASFNLSILDSGNTPLSAYWSAPVESGVYMSVSNYNQRFTLRPNQTYSIQIQIHTNLSEVNVSFPFNFSFDASHFQRSFDLQLFKPVINMTFSNKSVESSSGNFTYYTLSFINKNNMPVNLTAVFLLDTEYGEFSLTKSFIIAPNQTYVNVTLPKSTVESVKVSYIGEGGKRFTEMVYSAPALLASQTSSYIGYIFYIALTIGVVLVVVYIHLRHSKR
ncbi:MAG: hypothetical protein ACP5RE_03620 [Candidatus Acidifodinimicrobium sp.]